MSFAYSSPRSYFAEDVPGNLDYDDYLAWLAEFLMHLPDEIPERQQKEMISCSSDHCA